MSTPGLSTYLRGDRVGSDLPVLEASLQIRGSGSTARITGSIKNVSNVALKDVKIRTSSGIVPLPLPGGVLAPQTSAAIDLPASGEAFSPEKVESRYQSFGYYGNLHQRQPVNEADLWSVAPDLNGRRSLQIDRLIQKDPNLVCIYAQFVDPPAPTAMKGNNPPQERYYQWIRAIFAMSPAGS
jgi:hypothetical protein